MTAFVVPVRRPLSHRLALRVGQALTAWGARPVHPRYYAERMATVEASRHSAALTLPQLPR